MKHNIWIVSLLAAGIATGCNTTASSPTPDNGAPQASEQPTNEAATLQLAEIVDAGTTTFLRQQPTLATMLALSELEGGAGYNSRFPDYSTAGMQKMQNSMASAAQALRQIDRQGLSPADQTHQQILTNIFNYYAGDKAFKAGYIDTWGGHLPYIINQISGPLIDIPKLMQVQQAVTSETQARAYLTRLQNIQGLVDAVISKYKQDAAGGVLLPANLHPKTLAFFDRFLDSPAAEHALVTSFAKKLENVASISEQQRTQWIDQAIELVSDVVYPAYQRARQAVAETQQRASQNDGIWAQPDGDAFYAHAIQYLGDSTFTAEQIHQIGLDEVTRISQQMDQILNANGYTTGSVGERMMQLASLPGQIYPATDAGRQDLLDYLSEEIDTIMAKAPAFYGTLPEQAVEVRRIPPVSEAGEAGGFYTPPSLDGSRPGIYWINLRDMQAVPKFGLKTLTYHEAVPGHHFQIALNMAQQDIGLLRQNAPYNAYVEGWALYSEYVAATYMDMYTDDPLGDLGRLQAELYRAVRLVVDTGLHAKHWTRQQAIDYFHTTTGTSLSDVVPEVERYMAWPGQALGYKLGMLQFVALEQQARDTLKSKFDIRAFHDVVLLPGARPMALVKQDVENWIATQ